MHPAESAEYRFFCRYPSLYSWPMAKSVANGAQSIHVSCSLLIFKPHTFIGIISLSRCLGGGGGGGEGSSLLGGVRRGSFPYAVMCVSVPNVRVTCLRVTIVPSSSLCTHPDLQHTIPASSSQAAVLSDHLRRIPSLQNLIPGDNLLFPRHDFPQCRA